MTYARPLLYLYTLPSGSSPYLAASASESVCLETIDALSFTTIAPGGYGDLHATVYVSNIRAIPAEFRAFTNVALRIGDYTAFLGRLDEPGLMLNQQDADSLDLSAMGASSCLQDDPDDQSYSASKIQDLIKDELTRRSAFLPIDPDYTLILPSNPGSTFAPAFVGKTVEDELNEVIPYLGDYQWEVWGHASNRDAAGFPTWQLQVQPRDTTTVSYSAYWDDGMMPEIRPTVEYSYNVVQLTYRDGSNLNASSVQVQDSRLLGSGAQGSAPFPRRKFRKDATASLLSSTEATAIANAFLAEYQNGGFKIQVVLTNVNDQYGNSIPLEQVKANKNIYLPQMASIVTVYPQLQYTPIANNNLFWISETEYSYNSGQPPQLTITCDSFYDKASFQLAKLQAPVIRKVRSTKKHHVVRTPGDSEKGTCGVGWGANGLSGDVFEQGVNFKQAMTNTPSSISLSASSSSNVGGVSTSNVTQRGFQLLVTVSLNGSGHYRADYVTHGN